jgi:DedD protein
MAKRNGSEGGALDPALSQKKRARRRLIGAAALLLAAAIILPLVLDSEPRQQLADVEVEIPSRDTPLPPPAAQQGVAGDKATSSDGMPAAEPPGPAPIPAKPAPPATPPAAAQPPAAQPPATQPAATQPPAAQPAAQPRESSQALSPAPVQPPASPAPSSPAKSSPAKSAAELPKAEPAAPKAAASVDGRVVLQIGAYANPDSAKTMMERARKAGVRAFTETVQTPAGKRTRVRVGPFTDRESAERARGKLKLVGIDSTVVPLSP